MADSDACVPDTADVFRDKYMRNAVNAAFTKQYFSFQRIGKYCNASCPTPFTSAVCDLRPIYDLSRLREFQAQPFAIGFNYLFRSGFKLIKDLVDGNRKYEDIDEHFQRAVDVLKTFVDDRKFHTDCLNNILNDKSSETDVTTAFAEHLLGKLAPGQTYIIDKRCRDKPVYCKCGCRAKINYGDTGIGHEEVWHGFLDIVFSSHEGIKESDETAVVSEAQPNSDETLDAEVPSDTDETIDVEVPSDTNEADVVAEPKFKRLKRDNDASDGTDEFEQSPKSPGGKLGAEVKVFSESNLESQTAAQAIVFSLVQKIRHRDFKHHIIPTIVISKQFRIIMYDAENDILLRSIGIEIFTIPSGKPRTLSSYCILVIWMILHYRIFCSGIKKEDLDIDDIKKLQSHFPLYIKDCKDIYDYKLKLLVPGFPRVERNEVVDDPDLIQNGFCLSKDPFNLV